MQKIRILFSLLGSMAFGATEMENPLLKGVLIVDDSSKLREAGLENVQGIQFDGIKGNDQLVSELSPFLSDFPLTANGASALCSAITSYYRENEDVRMAVTLPDQNTSEGVVQLVLSPEKLGKINLVKEGEGDALTKWVRLKEAEPINQKTLAQDVAWMNTNPYRSVKASYQNTDKSNVTDIDLIVSEKKSWKITSGVENTGTMPIGTTRIFAGFNVNLFDDHNFKFTAKTTDHYKDYQSYSGEYVGFLPWRNTLKITGSYSGTTPNRQPFPRKHRESFDTTLRYAIPHWLSANPWVDQITYEAGFDVKGTNTNLFDQDDPAPVEKKLAFTSQLAASVNAVRSRGNNKITAGVDLVGSPARMLQHQSDADFNNLRKGATPQYFYSKLALSLEQKFANKWNIFAQGRGQFAFSNLIPAEQYSLGGFSTVRGYDEKVVGGDNALCGNLELRSPEFTVAGIWLPKFGDRINFLGFVDGGYAWFREKVPGTPADQGLLSLGSGLRYSVGPYFSSRLDVGFPLLKVEKDNGKAHIHFNAVMSY